MKLPAHACYKPSGVDCLGDVPKRWDATPLKRAVNFVEGPGIMAADFTDDGVPLLRISCIGGRRATLEDCNYVSAQLATTKWAHFRVKPRDLLISGSASTGFCSEVDDSTVGAIPYTGIIIIRPLAGKSDRDFIRWFFLSDIFLDQSALAKTGSTIQHFGPTHLSKMFILLPDLSEQRAIAAFLDREMGRVDRLVAKKRELIERLKEKRTALISRTVTRGLPPTAARVAGLPENPPLRPSGLGWLGDILAHWEVKRIKHLGSIRYGLGEPPEYVDDGLPFVRATDIKRGKINLDEVKKVRSEDIPWSRNPLLNLREILVVRSGAYTGDSAIVSSSVAGCIAGYDMVLSVKRGHPAFVAWALLSKYLLQGQIYLERMRAAQPHLNAEELGGFVILTPPLPEQVAIAAYLDKETAKLDALVGKVEEAVERLQEYRTALITAAVTGKIDVRKVVV